MTFLARILCSVLAAFAALPCAAQGVTQLASNESGGGVLVEQVLTQRTRPLYASIRTASGAFGPLRPIYPSHYYFGNQQLAVDDAGGAVAIWTRFHIDGSPPPRLLVASRSPGGRFGRPRLLARDVDYDPQLLAVNGRGDAIVVWRRFNRPSRYSFRPAGGGFSKPITIPGADRADAIALDDDGGAFLVWSSAADDVKAAYRPPGGSFGAPQPVDGPPKQVLSTKAIATDRDGDMLLVWREGDALKAIERASHSASFGPSVLVATALLKDDALEALTVAPSGQAAVAYGALPLKLASRDGGVWTAPQQLPVGKLTEGFRLAMNRRGDAALTWASLDRAVHGAYRPAGGAFGAKRKLAPPRPFAPGGTFVRPSLAIDGNGRATTTWEESDGQNVSVYARDFYARHASARVRIGRLPTYEREGPASNCRPSWGRVIRSSPQSTVLVSRQGDDKGAHYGCLLARGAPVALFEDYGLFPPIALAGPLVGYANDSCDPDVCDTFVSVTDLRDESDGVNRGAQAGPGHTSEVPALVLKPNGALAWVSCSTLNPAFGAIHSCTARSGKRKRVYAFDRRSTRPRLLDVSRHISPQSLSLHGSRLTWRRGGKIHAARLR
jgi:hypothetical protein